jgi:hypothetical protein
MRRFTGRDVSRSADLRAFAAAPARGFAGRGLGFAFAVALAAVTAYNLFVSGLTGSEDNLLFYMMGLNLFHGPELWDMAERAIAFYTGQGADEHALLRLEFRKTYLNEFPAPGAVYYGVSRVFKAMFDPAPNLYPLFLTQVMTFGLFAATMLAATIAAGLLWLTGRTVLVWAFALTVAFFAMTEYSPFIAQSFATILDNDTVGETAGHIVNLLFRPSAQFSPLGFTPRGHFALLTVVVFALRWVDRPAAAYWLAFALSFVHLSSSGMLLAILVGLDLILHPARFRRVAVLIPIAVTAALFAYRQTMWQLVGDAGMPVGIALGVVALFGLFLAVAEGPRLALARTFAPVLRLRDRLLEIGPSTAELILMAAGWAASALALWIVLRHVQPFEELQVFYFWGRVHGRLMMLLWPTAVFGVFAVLLAWLMQPTGRRRAVALALPLVCAACLAAASVKSSAYWETTGVMERVAADFFKQERRLKKGAMPDLRALGEEEWVLYYAMVKSVDTGKDQLGRLLTTK